VRVRAVNADGTSAPSNEIMVAVGAGCVRPDAPTLRLAANGSGVIGLTWTVPNGAPITYILQAGTAPGSANLASLDLRSAATSFTASSVVPGTYYVRVLARNACGATSTTSNELAIVVGGSGTPPAPRIAGVWVGSGTCTPRGVVCEPLGQGFTYGDWEVGFFHDSPRLTGEVYIPGLYYLYRRNFELTQSSASGTVLTFTGVFTVAVASYGRQCQPRYEGSLTIDTATNTMSGSFAGRDYDCSPQTITFSLRRVGDSR
jgi:hypothetical protein